MDDPVLPAAHEIVGGASAGFGNLAANPNPVRSASAVIVSMYLPFIFSFYLSMLFIVAGFFGVGEVVGFHGSGAHLCSPDRRAKAVETFQRLEKL
jgi:hypothetical protein